MENFSLQKAKDNIIEFGSRKLRESRNKNNTVSSTPEKSQWTTTTTTTGLDRRSMTFTDGDILQTWKRNVTPFTFLQQ